MIILNRKPGHVHFLLWLLVWQTLLPVANSHIATCTYDMVGMSYLSPLTGLEKIGRREEVPSISKSSPAMYSATLLD